ncbi:LysR family transcriptional regulator, hydrogen peroxide-inducible genes activator [Roseomonas rosea]|uniref:LysR family transcriptional regulator, hydrogen peroxide-inducible genes activator n=1 Tax=Muricoccus roseus TaxID=198092 RepID=A0A1M6RD10_9PROT|nr:LysR substrate-binding domain-containing protein [Roseomonas rosea]SHK30375.1 LysR family transcriptional regulator, hydrogen peroxide-inducible genes activator [Roseomonas rosea]
MSLAGLSLRDLEYLLAVAEHRHFGRAAERCGVSQPALSAQIRKLEGLLGMAVFERLPGRVLVTPRGEAVLARAAVVVREAQALLLAARADDAPLAGPFRLGAIPTLGPYLLPHLLRPMREAFPAMRAVLSEARTAELRDWLKSGALDAALCCAGPPDPALRAIPLFVEPFLLMHPAGRTPRMPLPLPGAEELLLLEEGHCLRDQTLAACGIGAPGGTRHATGLEMLRHMVAAGEGVSLMPAIAAAALGPVPGLLEYSPAPEGVGREITLLVRSSDPRAEGLDALAALMRRSAPMPGGAAAAVAGE